jgi:hypothetical protein
VTFWNVDEQRGQVARVLVDRDVAACDREPEADFELGRDLTDAALDASTKRLVDARELLA